MRTTAFALLLTPSLALADPPRPTPPPAFGPAAVPGPLTAEELSFGDGYRAFLDAARTPARIQDWLTGSLRGFTWSDPSSLPRLAPGSRLLFSNRSRTYLIAVIGRRPLRAGFHLVGTHIDTPSFRAVGGALRGTPSAAAVLHVSAYGGIKPYQWRHVPLRLVGEVRARGSRPIAVDLGPEQGFSFVLSDLATGGLGPQSGGERHPGDDADVIVATIPARSGGARRTFMRALRQAYQIRPRDLEAAELYFVPASPARDVGIDRSLVGGHGQDDRACSYAAISAIAGLGTVPDRTALVYLTDREEIGSTGTVGAASAFLLRVLDGLARATGPVESDFEIRELLGQSRVLSSDVTAGVDPIFPEVHEAAHGPLMGRGPAIMKYTGHGGKIGASDASPEYLAYLRAVFGEAGIPIQMAEIGRVDEGGGGTIAKFLAELGPEVVDLGVPLVSMHSPFELVHRRDLHLLARADRAFLLAGDR